MYCSPQFDVSAFGAVFVSLICGKEIFKISGISYYDSQEDKEVYLGVRHCFA